MRKLIFEELLKFFSEVSYKSSTSDNTNRLCFYSPAYKLSTLRKYWVRTSPEASFLKMTKIKEKRHKPCHNLPVL